jgi:hypothetical protein
LPSGSRFPFRKIQRANEVLDDDEDAW